MAIFGLSKNVKRLVDRVRLPKELRKLEKQLGGCLLEEFSGTERYYAAERLIKAKADLAVWGSLESNEDPSEDTSILDEEQISAIRQWELDELQKEFEMAKSDLKLEHATRAEVIQLGLAVRRLALGFEDEAKHFRNQCEDTLDELDTLHQFAGSFQEEWVKKKAELEEERSKQREAVERLQDEIATIRRNFQFATISIAVLLSILVIFAFVV